MKRLAKNKKGRVVCIFSYWIYAGPGCIVHLPLTTVGVCVDPLGGGQVCVAGNVHVKLPSGLKVRVLPGILKEHCSPKRRNSDPVKPSDDAVHVSSVGVAVWPLMVEGLHVVCGASS